MCDVGVPWESTTLQISSVPSVCLVGTLKGTPGWPLKDYVSPRVSLFPLFIAGSVLITRGKQEGCTGTLGIGLGDDLLLCFCLQP